MTQFQMSNVKFQIGSMAVFTVALALGLLATPVPSNSQQQGEVYRMGFLWSWSAPTDQTPNIAQYEAIFPGRHG